MTGGSGSALVGAVEVAQQRDLGAVVNHLPVDVENQRRKRRLAERALGLADRLAEPTFAEGHDARLPGSIGSLDERDAIGGSPRPLKVLNIRSLWLIRESGEKTILPWTGLERHSDLKEAVENFAPASHPVRKYLSLLR